VKPAARAAIAARSVRAKKAGESVRAKTNAHATTNALKKAKKASPAVRRRHF
jgi:hypothetical protein